MSLKLDFVIIGAQKAATTTLFNILVKHPALSGHKKKEAHFFSEYNDWKNHFGEYAAQFDQAPGLRYFEASPSYTAFPGFPNKKVWESLHEHNPDLKCIYLVREPMGRIISAYRHLFERGYTDLNIEDCLIHQPYLIRVSRYYTQIIPYIRKFGRDKVMIIDFEDFNKQRRNVMTDLCNFLEIDHSGLGDYENSRFNTAEKPKYHKKWDNPNLVFKAIRKYAPSLWHLIAHDPSRVFKAAPKLSPLMQEIICLELELEIRELGKLMNKDLSHWLTVKQ
jgi:hypothetical protein